jgi:hypothetical protein
VGSVELGQATFVVMPEVVVGEARLSTGPWIKSPSREVLAVTRLGIGWTVGMTQYQVSLCAELWVCD